MYKKRIINIIASNDKKFSKILCYIPFIEEFGKILVDNISWSQLKPCLKIRNCLDYPCQECSMHTRITCTLTIQQSSIG